MKPTTKNLLYWVLGLFASIASAAEITGPWQAEFESPRGPQKIRFEFKTEDGKLTGKTISQFGGNTRETEIQDGKVEGDSLSFVQVMNFQGNEIRINYTGKVAEDGIAFTREVGDRGKSEFKATRAGAADATPAEPAIPPRRGQAAEMGPDDKPAYEVPSAGFNAKQDGIPHGKLEMVEYESKTVGTMRKMQVYTPPGYSADKKYPVLYLLHGIGGDETEWQRFSNVDALIDNLIADKKAEPMIVVMPNGRAQKNDRAEGDVFAAAPAFATFERDLLDDVIPAIDARFSTRTDRESRALAGLSMGGGQTLNFGLGHLDTFAWIGAFSSAPNTKPPAELVPDPAATTKQLKLLVITCGNKDGLFHISKGVQSYLKEKEVPHVWHVDGLGHDAVHWSHALHFFTQKLFR